MSEVHFSSSHNGLRLSLLAFMAGASLWAIIGSFPDVPDSYDVSGSKAAQCQNVADVMASLDRSRNGVSLTCNGETLSGATAQ